MWGKGKRESLAVIEAGGSCDKRRGEQGWAWAEIVASKGRHAVHNPGQESRKLRIENAIICLDTTFPIAP